MPRDDGFDQQQRHRVAGRRPDVAQNRKGLIVGQVVDHVLQHGGVAAGGNAEVLDWLDDYSRYAISVTAHTRVTGPTVANDIRKAVAAHIIPYSTLTPEPAF